MSGTVNLHNDDAADLQRVIAERQDKGWDRYDEVWEGTYVMAPLADNDHQRLVAALTAALYRMVESSGGTVLPGANVSDRRDQWIENYRVPDVLVLLPQTQAVDCGTHWYGGPDLAIEIVSPGDRTFEKIGFYGQVGTRELLIVQRNPWRLSLYRNTDDGRLELVHQAEMGSPEFNSQVLSCNIRLDAAGGLLRLSHSGGHVEQIALP